jgi:Domain of unknown function (DUF4326)
VSPQRVQLRRVKGWRKPEGAVKVDRTTKWGNPFHVVNRTGDPDGWYVTDGKNQWYAKSRPEAVRNAVDWCRLIVDATYYQTGKPVWRTRDEIRRELAGKDLLCWCKPGDPCHADVLIEIANTPNGDPE